MTPIRLSTKTISKKPINFQDMRMEVMLERLGVNPLQDFLSNIVFFDNISLFLFFCE